MMFSIAEKKRVMGDVDDFIGWAKEMFDAQVSAGNLVDFDAASSNMAKLKIAEMLMKSVLAGRETA